MNRGDIFSCLKCFLIANLNFLPKSDIYFYAQKMVFKQKSRIFSFSTGTCISYHLTLVLSPFLSSSMCSRPVIAEWWHCSFARVLHFSWDHPHSYLLMHDLLYRDTKDPWHTASSSLSLKVWHRVLPSRHLFCLIFGNSLTLTENQEGKQRFSSAQFGLLRPLQPWRYPKTPAVCPFLMDPILLVFFHSLFFF